MKLGVVLTAAQKKKAAKKKREQVAKLRKQAAKQSKMLAKKAAAHKRKTSSVTSTVGGRTSGPKRVKVSKKPLEPKVSSKSKSPRRVPVRIMSILRILFVCVCACVS